MWWKLIGLTLGNSKDVNIGIVGDTQWVLTKKQQFYTTFSLIPIFKYHGVSWRVDLEDRSDTESVFIPS